MQAIKRADKLEKGKVIIIGKREGNTVMTDGIILDTATNLSSNTVLLSKDNPDCCKAAVKVSIAVFWSKPVSLAKVKLPTNKSVAILTLSM